MTLAAVFSVRNDALTNLVIIVAYPSPWPDGGVGILAINGQAPWKAYRQARAEQQT